MGFEEGFQLGWHAGTRSYNTEMECIALWAMTKDTIVKLQRQGENASGGREGCTRITEPRGG